MSTVAAIDPTEIALNHFHDLYRHYIKQVDLPAWTQQLTQQSLAQFTQAGFPQAHHEEWKYTRITPITKNQYHLAEKNKTVLDVAIIEKFIIADTDYAIFVDGYFQAHLSHCEELITNNYLMNIEQAIKQNLSGVQKQLAASQSQAFSLLNTAFLQHGCLLNLPAKKQLARPVHLIFITTQDHIFSPQRILINLAENAQMNLLVSYHGLTKNYYFTNVVNQINLQENAQLNFTQLQMEGSQGLHVNNSYVDLNQNSQFNSTVISLGSSLARHELAVNLNEPYAHCALNGLYLANNRQHLDHHTRIDHHVTHGHSQQFYKGIAADHAHAVFNGKIVVAPQAQFADAKQINKNLLLSNNAEIDTKPQLEIYADNVKCSHGATVGQLDENALFYLQARGIPEAMAKQLLIHAFISDVIEKIPHKNIARFVEQATFDAGDLS